MSKYLLHYSHWADQPTVLLACGVLADPWTVIYLELETQYCSAEARGYTFDRKRTTCKQCKQWIRKNPLPKHRRPLKLIIKRLLCIHKWKLLGQVFRCDKCRKVRL